MRGRVVLPKLPGLDPGRATRTLPGPLEHHEQCTLVDWARRLEGRYPELEALAAVPNGGYRPRRTAGRLWAEGVSPGYPDLLLDVARKGYHGLRLEMKRRGELPSVDQEEWHARLRRNGFRVAVCYSAIEAASVIAGYLDLPREVWLR